MRELAMIALVTLSLGLAACDNTSEIIEPTISNGNRLTQIDCSRAAPDIANDEICVLKDEKLTVERDTTRPPTQTQ